MKRENINLGFICHDKDIKDISIYCEKINDNIAYDLITESDYEVEYGENYSGWFIKPVANLDIVLKGFGYADSLGAFSCKMLRDTFRPFINDIEKSSQLLETLMIECPTLADNNVLENYYETDDQKTFKLK